MPDMAEVWLPLTIYDDESVWDDNLIWTDIRYVPSLLPVNAVEAELAIEAATARLADVPLPLRDLWVPGACPEVVLPWLAWALSVDEWYSTWPADRRREVVSESVSIHRRKGTRAAVVDAVAAAGLGDAKVIEAGAPNAYDGSLTHDGTTTHASADHWAQYSVVLDRPLSIEQAAQARRIIVSVAPLRCHLKALTFTEASNLYNGSIAHDGAYTHGVV